MLLLSHVCLGSSRSEESRKDVVDRTKLVSTRVLAKAQRLAFEGQPSKS